MGESGVRGAGRRWAQRVKYGALALLVVCVLIVVFQNSEQSQFRVLFWKVSAPQALMLLVTFLLGAGAGAVSLWLWQQRRP